VLPAEQHLVAVDATGAEVDERSVVDDQLVAVESLLEVRLQPLAFELGSVVAGLEGLVPSLGNTRPTASPSPAM
jgi:hypothetical protein